MVKLNDIVAADILGYVDNSNIAWLHRLKALLSLAGRCLEEDYRGIVLSGQGIDNLSPCTILVYALRCEDHIFWVGSIGIAEC